MAQPMSYGLESSQADVAPQAASGPGSRMRDVSIDIARGLAMLLVVLGHNAAFAHASQWLVQFIFLFHVPAFFFVSGWLMRPERQDPGRLAQRILLPFLAVGLALAVVKALVREQDPAIAVAGALWGTAATLSSSPLWFLPTLFLALLAAAAITRLSGGPTSPVPFGLSLAAVIVLSALALHLSSPPAPLEALRQDGGASPLGWFWNVDLVPTAVFFCLMGYWAGRSGIARHRLLSAGLGLAIVAVAFALGTRTDLSMRLAHPYALSLLAGLAGSALILGLGQALVPFKALRTVLDTIGRRSMSILLFHLLFQNAAVSICARLGTGAGATVAGILVGVAAGVLGPLVLSFVFERALTIFRKDAQRDA